MPAHRDEYVRLLGPLEGEDRAQLAAVARVRRAPATPRRGMNAMRQHFLSAASLAAC